MRKVEFGKIELCFVTFGIIIGIVGILHGSAELLGSRLNDWRNLAPDMTRNARKSLKSGLLPG